MLHTLKEFYYTDESMRWYLRRMQLHLNFVLPLYVAVAISPKKGGFAASDGANVIGAWEAFILFAIVMVSFNLLFIPLTKNWRGYYCIDGDFLRHYFAGMRKVPAIDLKQLTKVVVERNEDDEVKIMSVRDDKGRNMVIYRTVGMEELLSELVARGPNSIEMAGESLSPWTRLDKARFFAVGIALPILLCISKFV